MVYNELPNTLVSLCTIGIQIFKRCIYNCQKSYYDSYFLRSTNSWRNLGIHIIHCVLSLLLTSADTTSINWDTRFKIINGICHGLHFLHKELDGPLVHMNLVPSSIWLDDNGAKDCRFWSLKTLWPRADQNVHSQC